MIRFGHLVSGLIASAAALSVACGGAEVSRSGGANEAGGSAAQAEAAGTAPMGPGPAVGAGDPVARGEYLVRVLDCDTCHTPKVMGDAGPVPDMTQRLMGHPADEEVELPALSGGWIAATNFHLTAWAGPWGISYAANLTPDEHTGIAVWTDEIFIGAMRSGRHMGTAREILPPMPWFAYRELPDEDLSAILAFLKTLPAIDNAVPEPTPPPAAPGGS